MSSMEEAAKAFADWKSDHAVKKLGGFKAASFIYVMVASSSMAYVSTTVNLVTYLHGTMHTGIASSSTMVTNFIGVTSAFALLAGFLSDSYIRRHTAILLLGPFEFIGFGLLALQAHLPSLHPPPCSAASLAAGGCEEVAGASLALLYVALYTVALGEGGLRANMASFGGDQFDGGVGVDADAAGDTRGRSSFFNGYGFVMSFGVFAGLILIVWIERYKGFAEGFAACALVVLLALLAFAAGSGRYRHQVPGGSPVTRMLQVFVAAWRKRKTTLPAAKTRPDSETESVSGVSTDELLPRTEGFKFLDKATIRDRGGGGDGGAWWCCTTAQVEETKIVLRMAPIFVSAVIGYLPIPLVLTFTVQQGNTMRNRVGGIHIAAATLLVIPQTFQMIFLLAYDRILVPFLRRLTGYKTGVTHLQRVGAGFVAVTLAAAAAALVERRRREAATAGVVVVPMSFLWLLIQFMLLGVSDVTTFVGLLEFFSSEAPRGMRSLGTAAFWCTVGLSSFLGTLLVRIVNAVTGGGGGGGWLAGASLNESRLDKFYWLLLGVAFAGFLNYLFWASRYRYRNDVRGGGADAGEVVPRRPSLASSSSAASAAGAGGEAT